MGLNGSFPAAGGGDLGKKGIAESDCLFPLSKIARLSILLRGNGVFFGIADPAARIRFYLHKEFRAAGIRIFSTQRIGGGDLEENGHFL